MKGISYPPPPPVGVEVRRDWRHSAVALGLFLGALGLASLDLMEIVPTFAPIVSSPIFPFIHEPHDILAVLVGIYASYRWGTRWGALFLAAFFVVHVPYAYVRMQSATGLPEVARLAVMGGVAAAGVVITGELARSNATLRERNVRLDALIRIADSLGRPDSLEKKCSAIAEQLAIIAEADAVGFWVPDDGRQTLRRVGSFETGALRGGSFASIPFSQGLSGRAYVERSVRISNDYARAPEARPEVIARGVRSYLAIPILSGTHVLAVAGISSKERDHFGLERVQLIEALVEQLGPLLEHSRLLTALGATETLLHLVSAAVRHTGDGVAITREDGTFAYVNPAFETMTGYSAKELIGQNPRILKSGVHDRAFYERLWNTVLSGETFRAEMVNKKRSGELYSVGKTIAPVRDENGRITHFVTTDRDITERKRMEAALRASEERFSKAFLASPTGIILTNLSGNQIVAANDSVLRMMGYTREELIGRKPQDVPMWVRPEDYTEIVQTLREKRTFSGFEAPIRRKSGDVAWGLWSASLVDMSGPHLLVQVQDITERKEAQESQRARQKEIEYLYGIARALAGGGAYDAKLRGVLQRLAQASGAERVVFLAPDETGQGVRGVAGVDALQPDEDFTRIARSGNSLGVVALRKGSIIVANDYTSHPDATPLVVAAGVRSAAFLPVRFQDMVLGVVTVASRTPAYFTPERVKLMSAITSQVGVLLESARLTDQLRRSEEQARVILETAQDAVITIDANAIVRLFNAAAERTFGYLAPEIVGQNVRALMPEPYRGKHDDYIRRYLETGERKIIGHVRELVGQRKDGTVFPVEVSVGEAHLGDERLFTAVVRDITDRKQAEEQLKKYAFTDVLTDLPNRAVLMDRLEQALERVKRKMTTGVALLYIDLDRFKNVNDSMGHDVGDEMLKAVGRRLQERMRAVDTVARLGGDEFAVLLEGIGDVAAALFVSQRVHETFADPFDVAGHDITISASIGIVHTATGSELAGDLLRDADTAMYRAKSEGGARAVVFDTEMHARVATSMRVETELQRALRQQEFRLHYQPIVSLSTGRMTGCEALLRWQHPERGLLAPDAFMRIADETGLIVPMGRWVLHAVCAQVRTWRNAGLDVPRVNINLSARRFGQTGLLEEVVAALDDYALAAKDVALEIVESTAMRDVEDTAARLDQLASSGVWVVMDDFGTGYSSLGLLQRLPLHGIKIAQTFLKGLPTDARDTAIAGAIIEMAHSLRLNVVAEGVENEEQLAFLRAAQCDEIQGHLVSRPVPSEEFVHLMRKGQLL